MKVQGERLTGRTNRSVVVVGALGLLAAFAASCSGRGEATAKQMAFEAGNADFAQHRYAEAVVEYRRALQRDVRFAEARYKLAQAYDQLGDSANAAREYIRAADLMPGNPDAQVQAGLFLLVAGRFEDAEGRARRALAIDPRHLEGHLLRAQALAGLKDLDAAVDQIEQAIRMDPEEARTYATLGRLQFDHGKVKEAEAAFERAQKVDPQSVEAMTAFGKFYVAAGEPKKAEEWLRKAVALRPADLNANRALAAFYLGTNRLSEAEAPLKAVATAAPMPKPRLLLADYYFAVGRRGEARKILAQLQGDPTVFADVRLRQSVLEFAEGHPQEAMRHVDAVRAQFPNNPRAALLKARYQLADHQVEAAIGLAKVALAAEPNWAEAHYWLGVAYRNGGDAKEARAEFVESQRLVPTDIGSKLQLVQLNLLEGKLDAAASLIYEALEQQPRNAQVRVTLVDVLAAQGQIPAAIKEATFLAMSLPTMPQPQMQLGRLYTKQGQYAAAEKAFQRAIAVSGGAVDAVGGLVNARIAAGRLSDARATAEAQVAKRPNDPWANIYAARVYNAVHDTDKAEAALNRALAADKGNLQAHLELSRLYLGRENLTDGRKQLEAILAELPHEAWAETLVAMSLHQQHRDADAKQHYEAILANDPNAAIASNNLAMMYIDQDQNLDIALQLAQTAKRQAPDSPEVNDTLGLVYYKKGLASRAVSAFALSARLDPENPVYYYHLALSLALAGDKNQARTSLQRAVGLHKDFTGLDDAKRRLGPS